MRNDDCVTFENWWHYSGARVSAVDTHGTCVRLHEGLKCTGLSLEVKPGTQHHGYLNEVNFEDTARSLSSCTRESDNKECTVQVLFSKNVDSKKVTEASEQMLGVLENIASLAVSGFATVVPGLDLLYDGVKFFTGLFKTEKSTEDLIDAKVEEAFARNSASQMNAKINVIGRRLESLLSSDTPAADRRIDLGLALHTCEEVKNLFEDKHYSFSQNKLVSSPYLVAFSSLYLSVGKLVYELRPELRTRVTQDILELAQLNKKYITEAKLARKDKFTWTRLTTVAYTVQDKLVCEVIENSDEAYKTVQYL